MPSFRRTPTNWKITIWRRRRPCAFVRADSTCGLAITAFAGWRSGIPALETNCARMRRPRLHIAAKRDVPLLYWTAASWGAAISLSKDNPDLVADQGIVEALIDRALALDETFDHGAIHAFLIAYEPSRIGARGDFATRSRKHFDRPWSFPRAIRRDRW